MSAARMPKSVKALMFVASMALALSAVSGFQAAPLLGSGARTHSAFCPSASKARFSIQSFQAGRGIGGRRRTSGNGVTGLRAEADYYADLGCSRSADQDEIKKAFRQKARKLHPDVNKSPDAIKEFQQIQQAYEVLSDPQKKGLYDQFGEAGVKGGGFGGGGGAGFSDFGDFSPFGDIFDSFFGGGGGGGGRARKPQGPQQGDDLRLDLEIDFTKAIFGGDEKIKISHLETCDTCENGNGMKPGTKPRTCGTCGGSGIVTQVARTPLGMLQQQSACPQCQGTGQIVDEYCGTCSGRGRLQKSKQLMITIPPGVDSGSRLRIRKEGDAGPKGGPPGDLYVFLKVKPSKDFKRDGADIYTEARISYVDAILGCEIDVKTVDGDTKLTIPAGTQPETVMKMDGKGAPKLGGKGERGKQFVTVKVDIPTSVNKEEKELLMKLQGMGAKAGFGFGRK